MSSSLEDEDDESEEDIGLYGQKNRLYYKLLLKNNYIRKVTKANINVQLTLIFILKIKVFWKFRLRIHSCSLIYFQNNGFIIKI